VSDHVAPAHLFKQVTNAMAYHDEVGFYAVLRMIVFACCAYLPLSCTQQALSGAFALEWRRKITGHLMSKYINNGQVYYRMKSDAPDIDNPDQRIGQDVAEFTLSVVVVLMTSVSSVMQMAVMSGVLISISTNLFLYLLLGSLFSTVLFLKVFGSRLMRLTRAVLAQEATFRFSLIRIREHAESIAFYQGASFELMRCSQIFCRLMSTQYQKLAVQVAFTGGHKAVITFANFVPTLLIGPQIFRGESDLGTIGQTNILFGVLLASMTTLVTQLNTIANLGAQSVRIDQLRQTLAELDDAGAIGNSRGCITLHEFGDGGDSSASLERNSSVSFENGSNVKVVRLQVENVTLQPPSCAMPTVSNLSLALYEGESMLVCGESGIGKSSLLRAIGGLWAGGQGTITRSATRRCFFVPQDPYLCLGSLRENAEYPGRGDIVRTDADIEEALNAVNLGYLASRHGLDTDVDFESVLSGGEKQRLGFVRLLLRQKLEFAILDEATSALDSDNEDLVYQLLCKRVQCYASVGHRTTLEKFHSHKLLLQRQLEGGCFGSLVRIHSE